MGFFEPLSMNRLAMNRLAMNRLARLFVFALSVPCACLAAPHAATAAPAGIRSDGSAPPAGFFDRGNPCNARSKRNHLPRRLRARCDSGVTNGGSARGDFNGDGFGDLAIGMPGESLTTAGAAGAVIVIYGSPQGLNAAGGNISGSVIPAAQLWSQNSSGILGQAEAGDRFGAALVAVDLDGDGSTELIVGVPGEDPVECNPISLSPIPCGAVHVIFGSPSGLTAVGNQYIDRTTFRFTSELFRISGLGSTFAWGDFNGDTRPDLAIGMPTGVNQFLDRTRSGNVLILFSDSAGRFSPFSRQFLSESDFGVAQHGDDAFGRGLAAADFDGDGRFELAIGASRADDSGFRGGTNVGAIFVVERGATGLSEEMRAIFQSALFTASARYPGFGETLVAGDFDGNGRADLAIGRPQASVATSTQAGSVLIAYGPLQSGGFEVWDQNSPGIAGAAEAFDHFGAVLAAGDFDGNGFSDLAIGVPDEDLSGTSDAGGVQVIYGQAGGLSSQGSQFWSQQSAGIADAAEFNDRFGSALTAWNFGLDGNAGPKADLAIGVPHESVRVGTSDKFDAGVVHVIYGSPSLTSLVPGLDAVFSQYWHQNIAGVPGIVDAGDRFGEALY